MKHYGKELILDLVNCNSDKFNRKDISEYYRQVMILANVEAGDLHFWDYEGFWRNLWWRLFYPEELKENAPSHIKGTTAVQFILTSSIVIHALDDLKTLYVNLFSCDDFDDLRIREFTEQYFEGLVVQSKTISRGIDV